ncbi:MAG: hypothetical protein WCS52_13725 [bacterium]
MHRNLNIIMAGLALLATVVAGGEPVASPFYLPSIPPQHVHMRQLVENALGYIKPGQGLFDEASGYPVEGWNDRNGLQLRGFTQLTTIGEWIELLAHIAAGMADQPYVSRLEAMGELDRVSRCLVQDQADPLLSAQGLLCNFIGFDHGRRVAPLGADAYRKDFIEAYGEPEGLAVWRALEQAGWVRPLANGEQGEILRGAGYGYGQAGFQGALAPYASHEGQIKLMTIIDRRVVQVVFGDNANLSASVAKAIGLLLSPDITPSNPGRLGETPRPTGIAETSRGGAKRPAEPLGPQAALIRARLEGFLEAQQAGYRTLYDAKRGLFRFGWNATHQQYLGWADGAGVWQAAYADYFVNEFRGPMAFVVVRFGFPDDPLRYQNFKIKSRLMTTGRECFTLGVWEGSAFQALGLSLFMGERRNPSWRASLENAVRINLDYSRAYHLPGFLSEAYSGKGYQYSGKIGVPDLAVVSDVRITNAPSIYTLGVAYSILPDDVERFLRDHWSCVSALFTAHGPWEGIHMATQLPIRCQTAVHVMSLILGGLGQSDDAMARYLDQRGVAGALRLIYPDGKPADLLVPGSRTVVWSPDGSSLALDRGWRGWRLTGKKVRQAAVTWLFDQPSGGLALSGGELRLRYRNRGPVLKAVISLERPDSEGRAVSQEIMVKFHHTRFLAQELRIPLPATPGLLDVKKVTLWLGSDEVRKVDLVVSGFKFLE